MMAKKIAEYRNQQAGAAGNTNQTGTQRTRLNAYKHGLTGQIRLFSAEEHEALHRLAESEDAGFDGAGTVEAPVALGDGLGELPLQIADGREGFDDGFSVFLEIP
jgi:hypothetical protein